MEDKIKIFSTTEIFKAKVLEAKLDAASIPNWTINKQDSSYINLISGNIDLYVNAGDVERAKGLIVEMDEEIAAE